VKCQLCGDRAHEMMIHPGVVVRPVTSADLPTVFDGLRRLGRRDLARVVSLVDEVISGRTLSEAEKQPWINFRGEIAGAFGN
jgi:hypothetical protein